MITEPEPVVLIGGGGHAQSLMSAGFSIPFAGYVDNKVSDMMHLPYLGNDAQFFEAVKSTGVRHGVHIAIVSGRDCNMSLRRRIIERYAAFPQVTLIAPSATVARDSVIGNGTAVMMRAIVNSAVIGDHCVINTGAIVEHGVTSGSNVFIGPGAIVCGGVSIGSDCYIGAGAVVRNGVSIAPGCTVAMGAVVTHSIDTPGTYAGVPAHKIC